MAARRPVTQRLCVEELEGRVVPSGITASQSSNWSGYAILSTKNSVTSVSGMWTVPTSSGQAGSYSSDWVGIDGANSTATSVEQIGTDSDVSSNGTPAYYAWYEMYPNPSYNISMTVMPGDVMFGSVSYLSGSSFSLTITDTTRGETDTLTKTASGVQRSTAEWVVEDPSLGFSQAPFSVFTPVAFTAAQAVVSGTTGPIDGSNSGNEVNAITMVNGRDKPIDSVSGLTDTTVSPITSSFTVTDTPATTTPPPTQPTPPPSGRHHHGSGFGFGFFGPDDIAALSPTAFVNANSAAITAAQQNATSQSAAAAAATSVPSSVLLGPGIPPFTMHPGNDGTDSSDDTDDPGATAPAQTPAPAAPATPIVPGAQGTGMFVSAGWHAADGELRRAWDTCFAEGRWQHAASDGVMQEMPASDEKPGTTFEPLASVALAVGLGSVVQISTDGPAARRRRQRLAPVAQIFS